MYTSELFLHLQLNSNVDTSRLQDEKLSGLGVEFI